MGVAFNNNLAVLAITTNQHRAASYPHAGMFMDLDSRSPVRPGHQVERRRRRPGSNAGTRAHGVSRSAHRPAGARASRHSARRLGRRGRLRRMASSTSSRRARVPSMVRVRTGKASHSQCGAARHGAPSGDRRRRRRRALRRRGRSAGAGGIAQCAGRPHPDGARRGRDRQPLLRRSRRTDRRSGGAGRHRAGRRRTRRRMQVFELDVGRGRTAGPAHPPARQCQHRSVGTGCARAPRCGTSGRRA